MLPGREKKGGGKSSKQSWRNDCELYYTLWIGYKSWLQELLKWRNSYLLTPIQSAKPRCQCDDLCDAKPSGLSPAEQNRCTQKLVLSFKWGPSPRSLSVLHGHGVVPKVGLSSGSRCAWKRQEEDAAFPWPLLADELQRELWLAFFCSEMNSQEADSRGKDKCDPTNPSSSPLLFIPTFPKKTQLLWAFIFKGCL